MKIFKHIYALSALLLLTSSALTEHSFPYKELDMPIEKEQLALNFKITDCRTFIDELKIHIRDAKTLKFVSNSTVTQGVEIYKGKNSTHAYV